MSENELVKVLTPREKDVVRLLADGYGYKGIASELGISVKTVSCYRQRTTEKLMQRGIKQMNSIAMLTKFAIKAGITALCVLLLASQVAAAQAPWFFYWNNPGSNFPNLSYNLYSTTNVGTPFTNWTFLTTMTNIIVAPAYYVGSANVGKFIGATNYLTYNPALFFSVAWTNSGWHTNGPFSSVAAPDLLPPATLPWNLTLSPTP